ncbi:MAG: hypothetical protein AAGC74_01680 [Verrucomicrobiota bacterium]
MNEIEARKIREAAKREKLTVSEFIRRRTLPVGGQETVELVKCSKTKALVFSTKGKKATLTGEDVKEMLADFP